MIGSRRVVWHIRWYQCFDVFGTWNSGNLTVRQSDRANQLGAEALHFQQRLPLIGHAHLKG